MLSNIASYDKMSTHAVRKLFQCINVSDKDSYQQSSQSFHGIDNEISCIANVICILSWPPVHLRKTIDPVHPIFLPDSPTGIRADSRLAPSQWETPLQSNAVSHWLGVNLESPTEIIDITHHPITPPPWYAITRWFVFFSSVLPEIWMGVILLACFSILPRKSVTYM